MKILRAFQVINQDGSYAVAATYNVVDDEGNVTSRNAKESFYAIDESLMTNISAIEEYIKKERLSD